MTVFLIACVTVNPAEPEAYKAYIDTTRPLLEQAGAKISQAFAVDDVDVGKKPAESVMIVEYPDIDAVHNLFDSPEYQSIIPLRDKAFSTYSVSIIGG